jgi:GT2 family glycosyltransferase
MLTQVLEVELTEPINMVPSPGRCRVLVRHKGLPLGWINVSPKNAQETILEEDIVSAAKKQLGGTIVDHFLRGAEPLSRQAEGCLPVSVVVCTRNRTDYLGHCLAALRRLDYPVFEIIVVDNAPDNDDTMTLARSAGVRYVREERAGLDWARNRGIKEARHNIVAFTDDDACVDRLWLQSVNEAFRNPEVMAVSGLVAPVELQTPAQLLFELGYGGMGHGFTRKFFQKAKLAPKRLLWSSAFGIGANMAFRKEVFDNIGDFDVALDVGTPASGGGDVEMFFRLVNKGYTMQYEPSMLIWHNHRKSMEALKKQIRDNGCSTGCFLIHLYKKKLANRKDILKFFFKDWLWRWNLRNLVKPPKDFSRKLSIYELQGLARSPFAYRASQKLAARRRQQEQAVRG